MDLRHVVRVTLRNLGMTTLGCLALCGPVHASEVQLSYLQGLLPNAAEPVPAAGPSLMGDRVNDFDGSLSFVHTDLSIPGIPGLPVEFTRRHTAGRSFFIRGELGDWDLETPRITGVYTGSRGWVGGTGTERRCSEFGRPPSAIASYYNVTRKSFYWWTWGPDAILFG